MTCATCPITVNKALQKVDEHLASNKTKLAVVELIKACQSDYLV